MTGLSAVDIARLLERDPPTPEQVAIIEAPLEPLLVVAGAGSGKTETMSARVVWLIANGLVGPHEVLGLTFTRKAAGELGDRVRLRLRRLLRAMPAAGVPLPPALREAAGTGPAPGTGGGLDLARPTVSTYNSYAAALVGDHALRLGIEPTSRLLGEAGQWQLAHEVVQSWAGDLDTEAATSTVVEAVLSLSGALAEHLRSPAEARAEIEDLAAAILEIPDAPRKKGPYAEVATLVRSLQERARVLDLVDAYHRRKRLADAIDFGDQVAIAARLAREVAAVGRAERARYRVVLLDEYQDTSHAQLELLSALFGGGHPVTAVGDPHQSIYGWRGASAGGLERFPDRFPMVVHGGSAPAPVRYLSTSWRNDHAILDAANLVAGPLRAAAERAEGPARGEEDHVGRVSVPQLRAAPRAGAGTVLTAYAATVEEEAAAIARFVADRWRPSGAVAGGRVTAAVLCRKRSQFDAIEVALRAAGLPVEVVGLGGLLHTPEVVDLVSVLRAAHDPSRGDALIRLLGGARVRLGVADMHALAQWAGELAGTRARESAHGPAGRAAVAAAPEDEATVVVEGDVVDERSIVDALDDLPPRGWRSRTGRTLTDAGRARLQDLAALLRTVRSHTYLSLPELVGEAERLLRLDIEVAARPGSTPGRARAHLDAFRDVAVQFSDGADTPTLGAFLAWLDAAEREERGLERPVTEPDPDAVQLITVHAAKGLEWDVVAVAGLTDGVLPATATAGPGGPSAGGWLTGLGVLPYPLRGDADELPVLPVEEAVDQKEMESLRKQFRRDVGAHEVAEERRLAYVALTRARSALLLSGSWWRDRKEPQPPSPFLQELVRAGLVPAGHWAPEPDVGAVNPRTADPVTHAWPTDPFGPGPRRSHVAAAAAAVHAAMATGAARGPRARVGTAPGARADEVGPVAVAGTDAPRAHPQAAPHHHPSAPSLDRTLELLLAERDRRREPSGRVALPPHLSASSLVRLAADRDAFAEALRRPVPLEPSLQARRGTEFHAWVERYYAAASLVDVDALPGADDDSVPVDADGAQLRAAFLTTPWAARRPRAVEVDIETPVAGHVVRCRVDAVFDEPDGRVTVVDWKTGRPPADEESARARDVQLAVYRLAWSRWSGTPLDRVGAAFCYVGAGVTTTPERLLDESEVEALLTGAAGE